MTTRSPRTKQDEQTTPSPPSQDEQTTPSPPSEAPSVTQNDDGSYNVAVGGQTVVIPANPAVQTGTGSQAPGIRNNPPASPAGNSSGGGGYGGGGGSSGPSKKSQAKQVKSAFDLWKENVYDVGIQGINDTAAQGLIAADRSMRWQPGARDLAQATQQNYIKAGTGAKGSGFFDILTGAQQQYDENMSEINFAGQRAKQDVEDERTAALQQANTSLGEALIQKLAQLYAIDPKKYGAKYAKAMTGKGRKARKARDKFGFEALPKPVNVGFQTSAGDIGRGPAAGTAYEDSRRP